MSAQAFYLPQFIFEQPNFSRHLPQGEGTAIIENKRFIQVILPPRLDTSFDILRLLQLSPNNLPVANTVFRQFFDITLGPNILKETSGRDFDVGDTDATPGSIDIFIVKANQATGRIQFFVNNNSSLQDFDLMQIAAGKLGFTNPSNGANVFDTKYRITYIFEGTILPNVTDITGGLNDGFVSAGATLENGLNDLQSLRTRTTDDALIAQITADTDIGIGTPTFGHFITIHTQDDNLLCLISSKGEINNSSRGIMITFDATTPDALSIRYNDTTEVNDRIISFPNTRDLLRDGSPHYITFSLDNTDNFKFKLTIDDTHVLEGNLDLTGPFNGAPFLIFGRDIGGGIIDMTIEDITIAASIRTLQDIHTTFNNKINYSKVSFDTNKNLPNNTTTKFVIADGNSTGAAIEATPLFKEWNQKIPLTTNAAQIEGTGIFTDYSVYVDIQDDILKTKTLPLGEDIRFGDDAANQLPYIIESFDRPAGRIKAWFKKTINGAVDTKTFMYFDNPEAVDEQDPTNVWDADTVAVYLFNEGNVPVFSPLLDRAASPANAFVNLAPTVGITGLVGDMETMGAAPNPAAIARIDPFLPKFKTPRFNFECIFKTAKTTGSPVLWNYGDVLNEKISIFLNNQTTSRMNILLSSGLKTIDGPTTLNNDNFHYIVFNYDLVNLKSYGDGTIVNTIAETDAILQTTEFPITIGASNSTGSDPFGPDEDIDLIVISKEARSSEYIKTRNTNFTLPTTFTTVGAAIPN